MRRFTALYEELDATTRTNDKVRALADYFALAHPADAAHALALLIGHRPKRAVPSSRLREWAAHEAGIPDWLFEECYEAVGDLSETISLVLPQPDAQAAAPPLHAAIDQWIRPLAAADDAERHALLRAAWASLDRRERLVFHKLISGSFRVGAARGLVERALAQASGLDVSEIAHRLSGRWNPTEKNFAALVATRDGSDAGAQAHRPFPFFLASALDDEPASLQSPAMWQCEWKWDGIRAQLIHRPGAAVLWSRGQELIDGWFPELVHAARALPPGTVLDGEVLAWERGAPLPFSMLQRRLNRREAQPSLFPDVPVLFMAYDLLERDGADLRPAPLRDRRAALEQLLGECESARGHDSLLRISGTIGLADWTDLDGLLHGARAAGVEGVMLKRLDSVYGVGRTRGDWWKVKVAPLTIDAVLVGAQRGHGRRAGLFTDYTFAVWHEGELLPFARAYSGLSDAEFDEVDRFVKNNTIGRWGPVRRVSPELVFELGFDSLRASARHKAGVAARFPRMLRRRFDKPPAQADTLDSLLAMLPPGERAQLARRRGGAMP